MRFFVQSHLSLHHSRWFKFNTLVSVDKNDYKTPLGCVEQMCKYWFQTYGCTFTFTMYGISYQCESGYAGIRGET